jgi:endonuclease/exonuclease/phosphatase family metal-dependent hydrolase
MEKRETVKILSLNIEYCASITKGYWQYITSLWKYVIPHSFNAITRISKVINYSNADLCTFMEIDGGSFRTMNGNYLKKLANKTTLKKWQFFPVRHLFKLTNQGNGILTRYEMLSTENIQLKTNGENRCLSISKINVNEHTITVLTTQLALGKISRIHEILQIVEHIKNLKGPLILTGDLNTSEESELELILESGLKRLETTKTFPSWKPKRRIDYVFYSKDFEVVNYYVIDDLKISDHLPILAEFRLKK